MYIFGLYSIFLNQRNINGVVGGGGGAAIATLV